jgi:hypothetical protein
MQHSNTAHIALNGGLTTLVVLVVFAVFGLPICFS